MKKQTYKIMATALIVCSLCISTFATFAGMNNQGGGGDYEFDVPVETEPSRPFQSLCKLKKLK